MGGLRDRSLLCDLTTVQMFWQDARRGKAPLRTLKTNAMSETKHNWGTAVVRVTHKLN